MPESQIENARAEHQYHRYVGTSLPWYVRLVWIGFWCFAIYYLVTYLIPNVQHELQSVP